MNNKFFNIAIDGVAGSGKSTLGKALAKELNFLFLNTGNLYRALASECIKQKIDLKDNDSIIKELKKVQISVQYKNKEPVILINGKKINEENLHIESISNASSIVAKLPQIRDKIRKLQHNLAQSHNIVIEGRDIGSVVLPDADVKFFITASAEVRADRRVMQNIVNRSTAVNYKTVFDDMLKRDWEDKNRNICPLKVAENAVVIDTTNLKIEESVKIAKQECLKRKIAPAKEYSIKEKNKEQTLN